jgi:hypothetical protein
VRVRFQKTVLSMILLCYGFDPSLRGMQDQEQENAVAQVKPADRPALIQGKTIDAWLAGLKDRDPDVRKRAIEVLGERTLDPAVPADEKASLQIEVRSLLFSDKDAAVRQAAAFFADLFKVLSRVPIFSATPTVSLPSPSPSRSKRQLRTHGACSR